MIEIACSLHRGRAFRFHGDYALCELGENHEGQHACEVAYDADDEHTALWLRWDEVDCSAGQLCWLGRCRKPQEHGCTFALGHPGACDWEVHDPTLDEWLRARWPGLE
ncbi:hypothetical protein GXW82_28900 [Streptacidiphilus sp. 4-A2]|nr:hypothetical protein [Streptacidiphilus sp. 4-A2]